MKTTSYSGVITKENDSSSCIQNKVLEIASGGWYIPLRTWRKHMKKRKPIEQYHLSHRQTFRSVVSVFQRTIKYIAMKQIFRRIMCYLSKKFTTNDRKRSLCESREDISKAMKDMFELSRRYRNRHNDIWYS